MIEKTTERLSSFTIFSQLNRNVSINTFVVRFLFNSLSFKEIY
jgi:hypothetical protein